MKLLVVVPCYYPATRYGGPIRSIHDLCKTLVAGGAEVTVYTTNIDGPGVLNVPCGESVDVDGVLVHYFPVQRPRSFFRSSALRQALRQKVATFDVVYLAWLYSYPAVVAALECTRHRVPYVVSPRGMLDGDSILRKGRLKKQLYLATLARSLLRNAAAFHFTSRDEQNRAFGVPHSARAFIIPNGIELAAYEEPTRSTAPLAVPEGRKLVLFLGRLNWVKGIDVLTQAWPDVLERVPNAHLIVAGPDDDGLYAHMRDSFEAQGIGDSMSYLGMVDGSEKLALLRRVDLLVAPSYLESFGLAIVEAMACGRPVVITDRVNIATEIVEASAGLARPYDPDAIADAIVEILRDPPLAARMGAAGQRLVFRKFKLENTARAMREAMLGVMNQVAAG